MWRAQIRHRCKRSLFTTQSWWAISVNKCSKLWISTPEQYWTSTRDIILWIWACLYGDSKWTVNRSLWPNIKSWRRSKGYVDISEDVPTSKIRSALDKAPTSSFTENMRLIWLSPSIETFLYDGDGVEYATFYIVHQSGHNEVCSTKRF